MNIKKIFNELEKKFTLLVTEDGIEVSCKKKSYPEQYLRLNINEVGSYNVTYFNRGKGQILETNVNKDKAYLLVYFYSLNKFFNINYDRNVSNIMLNETFDISDVFNVLRLSLNEVVYNSINTELGVSIEPDELLKGYNVFMIFNNKKTYIQKSLSVSVAGLVLYNYLVKVEMFNKFASEIDFSLKDDFFHKAREYYILG